MPTTTTPKKNTRRAATAAASASPVPRKAATANHDPDAVCDAAYLRFVRETGMKFAECCNTEPLFLTEHADNALWNTYLASFPEETRQSHNCNTCRHFISRYGALVTVSEEGFVRSALWDETLAPPEYRNSVMQLRLAVEGAPVLMAFYSSAPALGTAQTGPWRHICVPLPAARQHTRRDLTPGQLAAEKLEDYKNMQRALAEYKVPALTLAVGLLESETMYRSDKVLGPAKWLLELQHKLAGTARVLRPNVLWRAVATAPAGFCHPRSSMIGTLLDDLAAGKSIDAASKAFAEKMHPLRYQRPQAAPSEGTIAQAEKMVEKLGIQRSLERRHITGAHELKTLWLPRRAEDQQRPSSVAKPVFGGLRAKGARSPEKAIVPGTTPITWAKFYDTVLPDALGISFLAPAHGHGYCGLLTAVHADAPPILRWDSLEARNTVSWYVRSNGRSARSMGLIPDAWTTVTALSFTPPMWATGTSHDYVGVIFLLDGAREMEKTQSNLFPEILRFELHGVRSVIEAHSKQTQLAPSDHPGSAGWVFFRSHGASVNVRVTRTSGLVQEYRIDRWD